MYSHWCGPFPNHPLLFRCYPQPGRSVDPYVSQKEGAGRRAPHGHADGKAQRSAASVAIVTTGGDSQWRTTGSCAAFNGSRSAVKSHGCASQIPALAPDRGQLPLRVLQRVNSARDSRRLAHHPGNEAERRTWLHRPVHTHLPPEKEGRWLFIDSKAVLESTRSKRRPSGRGPANKELARPVAVNKKRGDLVVIVSAAPLQLEAAMEPIHTKAHREHCPTDKLIRRRPGSAKSSLFTRTFGPGGPGTLAHPVSSRRHVRVQPHARRGAPQRHEAGSPTSVLLLQRQRFLWRNPAGTGRIQSRWPYFDGISMDFRKSYHVIPWRADTGT